MRRTFMNMNRLFAALAAFSIFYIGWWSIISLSAMGYYFFALPIALVCAILNLLLEPRKTSGLLWIFLGSAIGVTIDSLLQFFQVLHFKEPLGPLAPLWIVALWILFSSSFKSFSYLKKQKIMAFFLGGVGGPASYYAGVHFGLLAYSSPLKTHMGLHGLLWAFLFPVLLGLYSKITQS